jgi:hypothetical protein
MNYRNVILTFTFVAILGLLYSCGGGGGDNESSEGGPSYICDGVDITSGSWNNGSGLRLTLDQNHGWNLSENGGTGDISKGNWTSVCPNDVDVSFSGNIIADRGDASAGDRVKCSGVIEKGDTNNPTDLMFLSCSGGHIDPDSMADTWFHEPVEANSGIVGPDLNGDEWAGYYKSVNGNFEMMTAVIYHVGNQVTIQTSKPSGVASRLDGKIDAIGRMTLYDAYDNEDWTTLYGPVTTNSINLADYVFKGTQRQDTNIIILKR